MGSTIHVLSNLVLANVNFVAFTDEETDNDGKEFTEGYAYLCDTRSYPVCLIPKFILFIAILYLFYILDIVH